MAEVREDAEALHREVVAGLRLGEGASVLDAARRLVEIDPDPRRSASALASVCLGLGRPDEAEAALSRLPEDEDTAATALLRARCADAKGDPAAADAALDRALALDPDHPPAVDWLGARARKRGGEAAYAEAMAGLAENTGAAWPTLRLARHLLDHGDPAEALSRYREVAAAAGDRGELLMAICGDLGEAGRFEDAFAIVGPIYDPDRHGPFAGLNLVRVHLGLDHLLEARALLAKLRTFDDPGLAEHLAVVDQELARSGGAGEGDAPMTAVPLPVPVWAVALPGAAAALPPTPGATKRLRTFPFSDATGDPDRARLARVLPMRLAEVLRFETDAEAGCVVPVAEGRGPVTPADPWDPAMVAESAPDEPPVDVIVTGGFFPRDGKVVLEVDLVKVRLGQRFAHVELDAALDPVSLSRALDAAVLGALEAEGDVHRHPPGAALEVPEEMALLDLVAREGVLLSLVAGHGLVDPRALAGEGELLAGLAALAEATSKATPVPSLLYLTAVLAGLARSSKPAAGHRARALKLIDGSDAGTALRRLDPSVRARLSSLLPSGR